MSSANELITDFSVFNHEQISYGKPRVNARGGKSIKIQDVNRNTLTLSTPLILTWGINKMVDEDTGRVGYNMALQFPSNDYFNDSTRKFFESMRDFENKIIEDSCTYSKDWFGKQKMSREVAEALFSPMLKYPKSKETGEPDYTRSPSLRVKIPYWEGKFNVELYDVDNNVIFNEHTDLESTPFETLIPKTSQVACVLQCNGIWNASGKFGVTWQLVQAVVRRPVRIQGQCFIKLNSDDRKVIKNIQEQEEQHTIVDDDVDNTHVQDSDNEEEQQINNQEEQETEQVEEPKKKMVRKKKTIRKA